MTAKIARIVSGEPLSYDEASELLTELTSEDLDQAQAAAALAVLAMRGESSDEIRAFANGLGDRAIRPAIEDVSRAVDVVGTGGDSSGSLNLSTGAALVAAAAGVDVIKHGNRSVSSLSGSFDVLQALGLDVPWDADRAGLVFEETRFTYLFAPSFHPSMKSVAPVRQSLGIRTIFNLVGPLANPARVRHLVLGAYSPELARTLAQTLSKMDIERAFVVHGDPGWDEPTPVGPYLLLDVSPGEVREGIEDPLDAGFDRCWPDELAGSGPEENAEAIRRVLDGERSPHRDALALGASLALRVTGVALEDAVERSIGALDDGLAGELLTRLVGLAERETSDV